MMHFNPSIPKWTVRWAMPAARAASLRPQPASPFSRSGIAIAVFALSYFAAALVSGAGQ